MVIGFINAHHSLNKRSGDDMGGSSKHRQVLSRVGARVESTEALDDPRRPEVSRHSSEE